jgi:uncharacterized protein YndB with AHSA1/START domain
VQIALGAGAALALMFAARARAEIVGVAVNGFEVRETTHVAASPDKVYAGIATPAAWWSSDHTYSKNAANLTLDARAGGCWCEKLADGGSVKHLEVVLAIPGKALRLRGNLGPLQPLGAEGAMSWTITLKDGGSDIEMTYAIGGYDPAGWEKHATPVDQVLGEQVARLKRYLETGSPEAKS